MGSDCPVITSEGLGSSHRVCVSEAPHPLATAVDLGYTVLPGSVYTEGCGAQAGRWDRALAGSIQGLLS